MLQSNDMSSKKSLINCGSKTAESTSIAPDEVLPFIAFMMGVALNNEEIPFMVSFT